MTREEIIEAIQNDDMMPFLQDWKARDIVDFVLKNIQPSLPDGLEEAAEEYNKQVIEETKCHHNALTYAEGYEDALLLIPGAFIAGAEWQKAKMLEGAVEGTVIELGETYKELSVSVNAKELNQVLQPLGLKDGDKVIVQIRKK